MRICIQTGGIVPKLGNEKGYEAIAKAGFTAIDWNLDRDLKPKAIKTLNYRGVSILERPFEEVKAYYEPELELIRKNGLTIAQAHAPFHAYLPGHPELLDFMIEIYKTCIRLCDWAGCKALVIHGISLEEKDETNTPETIEALNWHLYESLIPTLQECNVVVCLENLFTHRPVPVEGVCADPHEAVRYIDTLNEKAGKEAFAFCLDVGHLEILQKDLRTYIPVLGKRIKLLHLHDNDGIEDLHMLPLTGTVNWQMLCDCLRDIGYAGDINFETCVQNNVVRKFDESLLVPFLVLTHKIGESIVKKIQG